MVVMAGCDKADKAVEKAKETGKEIAANAKVDFGDFDMKGLQEKFTSITAGFKDVSADNVDGLTSKISELTGSLDKMGIGNLKGVAKTAVDTAIKKFGESVKTAMEGISDESMLSKLKPVVDSLMEKLKAFN
jgi:hypothetical protein